MTHSLHRHGPPDALRADYVLLCTPAIGVNHEGAAGKLQRILDLLLAAGPVNIGFYGEGSLMTGVEPEQVRQRLGDRSRLRCCFASRDAVRQVLTGLREADLGLSVAVTGPLDELRDLAAELDLAPHSASLSLGVFGDTARLAGDSAERELTTMCGHGMISVGWVRETVRQVRAGALDLDAAVRRAGAPCTCGIYNPRRARRLLDTLAIAAAEGDAGPDADL